MILQPPCILLEGAPGSGKTDSLITLIEAGLELFVIGTEPGFVESLLDSCERRKLPVDKLHWHSCLPSAPDWKAMQAMVTSIGAMGYKDLQDIKSGIGKDETRKPAMDFLQTLKDFHCERTGQHYGDVSKWDHTRALAWDSLSGISLMAAALTVGYKPAMHQGEWGVAMNFIEQLLLKGTSDRHCFFVLTAHIEREINELNPAAQVMASTLGKKLAPKIPRFFSEVVWTRRAVDAANKPDFYWSTIDNNADLKNRALPIGGHLTPSFRPIVEAFHRRLKASGAATPPVVTTPSVA